MPCASLIPSILTGSQLPAFLAVLCFSAGLNVYATVAMLGLLAHARVLALPPGLQLLGSWYVIAVCAALFLVEFVGDKIPVFDLLWNAMHTFVRIPVAGLLTYSATAQLPAWQGILEAILGALLALAAPADRPAARAAVTRPPEPCSNIALSLGEDGTVAFLIWYATGHPYSAAAIVVAALGMIVVMSRAGVGALRDLLG